MEIPSAMLVATIVLMIKRRFGLEVKPDPIRMPNKVKVESNNVFVKNLRIMGPTSLLLSLDNPLKPK